MVLFVCVHRIHGALFYHDQEGLQPFLPAVVRKSVIPCGSGLWWFARSAKLLMKLALLVMRVASRQNSAIHGG
jgi:hypothetical protein